MKREEFIFTIGYEGDTAIVDGHALKQFKQLSTMELFEKGLFKAAFSSAIYSGDEGEIGRLIEAYNELRATKYSSSDDIKRLFGIQIVSAEFEKVEII
ncbi:MAG: hypothetical protein AB1798_05590 [Spirochaetota bacterium]